MTQDSRSADLPQTSNASRRVNVRSQRRDFIAGIVTGLRVVWPVVSGLILIIVGLGVLIGIIEGWKLQDSLYFSFVTGLTIGYGDLVPKTLLSRTLAVMIGATGILMTALLAAVAVKALSRSEEK
jgi:hypothetical protein